MKWTIRIQAPKSVLLTNKFLIRLLLLGHGEGSTTIWFWV
jgi:hypothetical protein